jgi:hypothetical protein
MSTENSLLPPPPAPRHTVVRFCPIYLGGEARDIGHPNQEGLEKLNFFFFWLFTKGRHFFKT